METEPICAQGKAVQTQKLVWGSLDARVSAFLLIIMLFCDERENGEMQLSVLYAGI